MHAEQIGRNDAADPWFEAIVEEVGDRDRVEGWLARVPSGYREGTTAHVCADDLQDAAGLAAGAADGSVGPEVRPSGDRLGRTHRLRVRPAAAGDVATFRMRRVGTEAVELTGVLPLFESFGLAVTEAVPFRVAPPAGGTPGTSIDDFGLRVERGAARFDLGRDGDRLIAAVDAVSACAADVDGLNRLVTLAGLEWRQVVVLRAYRRYARQIGALWPDLAIEDALAGFPDVTGALVRYFEARFVPGGPTSDRSALVAEARAAVLVALEAVTRLPQDQMLRSVLGFVDATLRTNWFRGDRGGERATMVLKLDSGRVPGLRAPRPYVEAFVHSPSVEGIHIRNGPIARGGIRWSDRPGDFRTEVLGLAEAQTKKNAIIVPTGAKGGFVVRTPAGAGAGVSGGADADEAGDGVRGAVLGSYREFVAGLLDITDNIVGGVVHRPSGVVAADADDPYLVVAADKGTATYSDDANALSEAYGFWLGDAFASGGRHGYDHKAMGITARGAWVSVRRHFRHLGIDVQREPVRVAGVGDMSGDVFGNGMLQSRAIELVAAFDHRHVFIDPRPDHERAYEARARLAARGPSSWADYDLRAVSAGGGVWPRDAKEIALGPEARAALGITAEVLQPPALISAILTAPVDLLWFGGVGTFVKSPDESDEEVGDRANDVVRVTANLVRARVIAEGGNLGITQRGRIRYSRRGGRINTDFIDNAAGVATSDREVNLKVLLRLAIDDDRMDIDERDVLLAAAADTVAGDVLRQVDHSVAALDRSQPDSAVALDAYEALLTGLERAGIADRHVESLPLPEEFAARRSAGAGLIRPELAVLLAHAKSDLVRALDGSAVIADASLLDAVMPYFPEAIRARAADLVPKHPLYAQLAATDLAGGLVDSLGVVWAHETSAELGRPLADVAGAFWAARQVTGAAELWADLESVADVLGADDEATLQRAVAGALTRLARCYLRRPGPVVPSELIDADRPLAAAVALVAGGADQDPYLADVHVVPLLTTRVEAVGRIATIGELAPVARRTGRSLADAAAAFRAFDVLPGINGLRTLLGAAAPTRRWQAWQRRALIDDVADLRQRATGGELARTAAVESPSPARDEGRAAPGDPNPGEAMRQWAVRHSEALGRAEALVDHADPRADQALTVAALAVRILAGL